MTTITADAVADYRMRTFRLSEAARLQSAQDALDYVNQRGFVYFWPIKGVLFPSLWTAVAGNRPVADKHDDPGHVTWGWKDGMLDKRQWYYAKILRGKATMISLETAPYFYALSENYGDPENDYLQLYEDGLLTREAKLLYETLLREGALNTVRLRRAAGMTSKAAKSAFDRALTQLQRDFKILPVGVAEAGAWRYSFIYELVHRYYPDLPQQARTISRGAAQEHLLRLYFAAMGAAQKADVRKLFQWKPAQIDKTLKQLIDQGALLDGEVKGENGRFYMIMNFPEPGIV